MSTEHTCDECGETFDAPQALGAHKSFKHSNKHDKEYKDADKLRELYHDKGLSTYEIAKKHDVAASTIRKYMERGGVERDASYADPTRPASHTIDPHGEGVGNAYEKVESMCNGERQGVYIHRLVAYAHGKLSFEGLCDPDTVVHHKSGHGLDNRPENLEVKSFEDHAGGHANERYKDGAWRDKEKFIAALDGRTQEEAADILGCSKRTIYVWKDKHGVE